MNRFKAMPACIGLLIALSSVTIQAESILEEIIVTATKRGDVAIQDIPIAIRAVTGDVIEKYNLRSLEDLSRLEPSLQYETAGTGDLQLVIRGIQSAGAGTVGLYFDETVITGANFQDGGGRTPDVGSYDVERVEILKGPQGTLFGASSMSGTVRIISNKPNAEVFDANFSIMGDSVRYGGEGYGVNGMANIPLVKDTLAMRVVGWQREAAGYIDHYAGVSGDTVIKDANESEVTGGRVMFRWTPRQDLTVDAFVQRQDTQVDGPQTYALEPSGIHTPTAFAFIPGVFLPAALPSNAGELKQDSPVQQYWDDEVTMFGGTVEYDLGFGSVLGTISKYQRDTINQGDTTAVAISFGFFQPLGPPGPIWPAILTGHAITQFQERDVFTSELRFSSDLDGPINFVAGWFYSDDEIATELDILQTDAVTGIPACASHSECITSLALAQSTLDFARTQSIDYKFYALFTHVDFEINEQFTIGGGIRYFNSDQHNLEFTLQEFGSTGVTPPSLGGPIQTVPAAGIDAKVSEDDITWDASVSYRQHDNLMYYFRAATGYRQGGINDSSLASNLGITLPAAFISDSVTSYELGAKSSWLDDRLTLNATIFKMYWDDMHVPGQTPNGAIEFIVNAGKSEVDGFELEMFARPTEQWSLSFGMTLLDARLTADQILSPSLAGVGTPSGLKGDNIPNVADWQFAGSVEYSFPFSLINNVETALRANYSYTGKSDTFFNNQFSGFTETGDYFLLDLNAAFTYKNWGLTLFIKNATDERAILDFGGVNAVNEQNIRTVVPRTVGMQVTWNFGAE